MQKGPEYFMEAAYLVSRKLPDVRFVMAGSGDMLPRMVERMAELRLLDRFHFTGFVNEERRNRLLAMADVFVMTSVSEPFGITPVEAIQHDVPVIVTKQCGVAEILRSAVKVDFWDVRKIADAIIKVLTEDGLAREIVAGAREELAAITWDRAADQVQRIYREMT
jgi:glycosyltransferase involved in cell wall biosynthesis